MTLPSAATLPRSKLMSAPWRLSAGLTTLTNAFERPCAQARVTAAEWLALFALLVLAAVLRFWGLDGHGLEYDEETMAMPVMHILEHGTPQMPSGMTYVRAVSQLYLMAGSVVLFGPTEWALRLPSVLCGLMLIVGCFFLGRRFLAPLWNLTFVGVITISSIMILDAQEARMYVFMVASLVWCNVLVFRWERTQRAGDLVAAVLMMIVAIQFHSLAVFGAAVLLMPGLLHGDHRRLLQGVAAVVAVGVAFALIHHWVESFFPPMQSHEAQLGNNAAEGGARALVQSHDKTGLVLQYWPVSLLLLAFIGSCVEALRRRVPERMHAWLTSAFMALALCAQLFVLYHLAALLYAAGAITALRARTRWTALLPIVALSLVMLGMHVYVLYVLQPTSLHKLLGLLAGVPSIWSYLIFARYAPLAAGIVLVGAAWVACRLVRREPISDVWLYLVLAAWLPLVVLGVFTWYPQQRYTEIALIPVYLGAVATVAGLCSVIARQQRWFSAMGAMATCVLVGNPAATAHVVNAGYRIHPDHKGAAEFIRSVREPHDVLLAEDVLQQTYYLGRVDYWLIGERVAQKFARDVAGRKLDIYTHTPVMTQAGELNALIARHDRGAIYIIGSGEAHVDGRMHVRGPSLAPLFKNAGWEVVYHGRDGVTRVWRIPAPTSDTTEARSSVAAF